ncbi:transcription factor bHLH3-like [Hibiscus syriacus]|uniref:Transcription factor bHLH3-like n=1 Tax=Hibiscus syriacus TaxID=106335 RepID=A0A6A2X0M1_HIBSY|nr:transcription factor bHLH3-like [Hibiscus syriacus]
MRPMHGEQWLEKDDELLFQSLQKGPVTGSGHNPCTEIPGRETGVCKLGGMNVAGYVTHAPPAFPRGCCRVWGGFHCQGDFIMIEMSS